MSGSRPRFHQDSWRPSAAARPVARDARDDRQDQHRSDYHASSNGYGGVSAQGNGAYYPAGRENQQQGAWSGYGNGNGNGNGYSQYNGQGYGEFDQPEQRGWTSTPRHTYLDGRAADNRSSQQAYAYVRDVNHGIPASRSYGYNSGPSARYEQGRDRDSYGGYQGQAGGNDLWRTAGPSSYGRDQPARTYGDSYEPYMAQSRSEPLGQERWYATRSSDRRPPADDWRSEQPSYGGAGQHDDRSDRYRAPRPIDKRFTPSLGDDGRHNSREAPDSHSRSNRASPAPFDLPARPPVSPRRFEPNGVYKATPPCPSKEGTPKGQKKKPVPAIFLPSREYIELSHPSNAYARPSGFGHGSAPSTKLIVFDLNGALVYRSGTKTSNRRPYLGNLLAYIFSPEPNVGVATGGQSQGQAAPQRALEGFVWSSAQPQNVRLMVDKAFGETWTQDVWGERAGAEGLAEEREERRGRGEGRLLGVWARDKMRLPPDQYNQHVQTVKDLRDLHAAIAQRNDIPAESDINYRQYTFDESNTILLDDSTAKAVHQPFNHICLPEFDTAEHRAGQIWHLRQQGKWPVQNGTSKDQSMEEGALDQGETKDNASEGELDEYLLCVIGILEELRSVDNVPAWIRGGGLTRLPSGQADDIDPATCDEPTLKTLPSHAKFLHWYAMPEMVQHWRARGVQALEREGIKVDPDVDMSHPPVMPRIGVAGGAGQGDGNGTGGGVGSGSAAAPADDRAEGSYDARQIDEATTSSPTGTDSKPQSQPPIGELKTPGQGAAIDGKSKAAKTGKTKPKRSKQQHPVHAVVEAESNAANQDNIAQANSSSVGGSVGSGAIVKKGKGKAKGRPLSGISTATGASTAVPVSTVATDPAMAGQAGQATKSVRKKQRRRRGEKAKLEAAIAAAAALSGVADLSMAGTEAGPSTKMTETTTAAGTVLPPLRMGFDTGTSAFGAASNGTTQPRSRRYSPSHPAEGSDSDQDRDGTDEIVGMTKNDRRGSRKERNMASQAVKLY